MQHPRAAVCSIGLVILLPYLGWLGLSMIKVQNSRFTEEDGSILADRVQHIELYKADRAEIPPEWLKEKVDETSIMVRENQALLIELNTSMRFFQKALESHISEAH